MRGRRILRVSRELVEFAITEGLHEPFTPIDPPKGLSVVGARMSDDARTLELTLEADSFEPTPEGVVPVIDMLFRSGP